MRVRDPHNPDALDAVRPGPCAAWSPESSDMIKQILERVGDKWSVLILATLGDGPLRYTALHASVTGISQRMLTLTLRQLVRDGLVQRFAYAETPPRVEYDLTELGHTLHSIVNTLAHWAGTHHEQIRQNRHAFDNAPPCDRGAAGVST